MPPVDNRLGRSANPFASPQSPPSTQAQEAPAKVISATSSQPVSSAGNSAGQSSYSSAASSPSGQNLLSRLQPLAGPSTQGVSRHHPYAHARVGQVGQASSKARGAKSITTINAAIAKLPLPPNPRKPQGPYEQKMYEHWYGLRNSRGKVLAHSHAQEFLRLSGLKSAIGLHKDSIDNWVDYMEFGKFNTSQCIEKKIPEVLHTTPGGKQRIGRYQEPYNLWSVHDSGNPDQNVTFYRPAAAEMSEQDLGVLKAWKAGIDYVGKK